jgi:hypothetical protein
MSPSLGEWHNSATDQPCVPMPLAADAQVHHLDPVRSVRSAQSSANDVTGTTTIAG